MTHGSEDQLYLMLGRVSAQVDQREQRLVGLRYRAATVAGLNQPRLRRLIEHIEESIAAKRETQRDLLRQLLGSGEMPSQEEGPARRGSADRLRLDGRPRRLPRRQG